MAEEHTVSAFTWITPAHCSNSLTNEYSANGSKNYCATTLCHRNQGNQLKFPSIQVFMQNVNHLHYFCSQARKYSTTRPTVKFYNLKEKIFSKKKSSESEKLLDDEDDDAWLNEPAEKYEPAVLLEAEQSSFLDLNSKHLTTYLANTKDKASNHTTITSQGLKKRSQPASVVNPPDDNDFSINFD